MLMISSYLLCAGVACSCFSEAFRYMIKLLIRVPSFPFFWSPLPFFLYLPPPPSSSLLRPLEKEILLPPTATRFQSSASGILGEKSGEDGGLAEQLDWKEFILGLFYQEPDFFFCLCVSDGKSGIRKVGHNFSLCIQ